MPRQQKLKQDRITTLRLLREYKVYYTEPNPNHFKMRDLNYWPSSGKIFVDGAQACLPDRGPHALEATIRARGYRRSGPTAPKPQPHPPTMPTLFIEFDTEVTENDDD